MSDKQSFGDILASLRESRRVSQQAVGELIGVSRSAVNGYEKGKSFPVADKLVKLAQYFGVSVEYLLTGENALSQVNLAEVSKNSDIHSGANTSAYPPDQNNAHALKLLSDIPLIELPHVSFKARASFNYAQLQRHMNSDIFDTLLHRLPLGKTPEDYKDAVVFDIEGDSMEPSLLDGQKVIAWPIPEGKWEYLHNTICVIDYGDTVTVKAVFSNDLNNMDGLTLHATGGKGGSFIVAREHIHSIWEVREFYGVVPVRLLP
jgi:transcriptional regulator with XRE-family HTH domain